MAVAISFGTIAEMKSAHDLIPASHTLFEEGGTGHDLLPNRTTSEVPAHLVNGFKMFQRIQTL
jgi:hypothetical protein